ncbi:thermonuclease family protein [Virgibacillus sp. AGTR]|uniref:thermonuclease family protein n=1 Tax=Virgibacillus sp. AGTR TaxID=2812055 RepID=UPI001D16E96B|nr:thermonuclease family protein [Virgibacillus sp. AGTR]MCC2252744.1 thermonuclease family protein [Virgibacillus sp. AGTR]
MIKQTTKWLCAILFLLAFFTLSACEEWEATSNQQTPPETLNNNDYDKGLVVYVIDGDTFDVQLENGETERIRPILVNAPEICHDSSPADCEPEPYGDEATDFTRDLLDGETVYLEQDVSERDPYDRRLYYVYLEDGQMFQEIILAEGLAEIAVFEPDVKYQSHLETFEQKAKDQQINMWSESNDRFTIIKN